MRGLWFDGRSSAAREVEVQLAPGARGPSLALHAGTSEALALRHEQVDWPDRWFHIRVSQTEPIVRVICEQRDAVPSALFDSLQEAVRSL